MLARVTGATASGSGRAWTRGTTRLGALVERSHPVLVVGAVTLVAALAWGRYAGQVATWFVQTDELQFVRLAMSIAEDGTLRPELRGADLSTWNQLYPLLVAPLYALFDTADAFKAAHWLNAFLMASTAIPTYLLARELGTSKLAGYLVAALSVCVPWLALADMLRDDAVAYPAFTWAVLAMQRALAEPGWRRDALALAAILVAATARTQFVVLAPVFLLALAVHEGLATLVLKRTRAELVARLRAHGLLLAAAALAALYVLVRGYHAVLGPYQSNLAAGELPPGLAGNVAMHLSMVAVAIGVIPFTFAVGWALGSVVRPADAPRHAYAVLLLVTGAVVAVAASTFVLRNAGTNPFDRYFFYLVPVALVGMVVCIDEARRRWWMAAAAALLFAWIAGRGFWAPALPPFHQSPASAFNSVLDHHAGRLGLTGAEAARWGGMVVALAAAVALRFVPARVLLPVLGAGLLLFGAAETRSVFRTMAGTQLGPPPQNVGAEYEPGWIDAALPDGGGVALLPEIPIELPPGDANVNNWVTTSLWWDTEFWNKRVADAYVPANDAASDPTPFPKRALTVQPGSGRIDVAGLAPRDQQPYVVLDAARSDLRPAGEVVRTTPWGLDLIRAERPYRTPWAAFGLSPGDALYAGTPVRIKVFERRPARVTLRLFVPYQSTPEPVERRFTLSGGTKLERGSLSSGKAGDLSVCLRGEDDTAVLTLRPSKDTDEPIRLERTVVAPGSC
jgi:hypothetical protein